MRVQRNARGRRGGTRRCRAFVCLSSDADLPLVAFHARRSVSILGDLDRFPLRPVSGLSVCALLRNTDFLGAPRIVSLNRLPRRPAAWAGPGVGLGVEHYMM